MTALLRHADDLLRGTGRSDADALSLRRWWILPAIIVVFAPVYGAVSGSFALNSPERLLQVLYSAIKIPLLLGVTSLLCLPPFLVLSTVLGLRDEFRRSLGAILAGQAAMSIALASLAPVTRFFYISSANYRGAILFNGLMFAVATLAAQFVIRRCYRPLIAANPRHRVTLVAWAVLYVFVGVQMGWSLRPFIGFPGAFPTFFRAEPFTNAYVEVAHLLAGLFRR
jgi:hypothetical protein